MTCRDHYHHASARTWVAILRLSLENNCSPHPPRGDVCVIGCSVDSVSVPSDFPRHRTNADSGRADAQLPAHNEQFIPS
jgi:hypothetical protein